MSKKLTLEYVKEQAETMHPGCKVVSKEYINAHAKLDIICEKGHNFKMNWAKLSQKRWCPKCSIKNKTFTYEYIKSKIKELHPGCKLLSKEYVQSKEKIELICENGHKFQTNWNGIKIGYWCNACRIQKISFSIDHVKLFLKTYHPNAKLLSTKYKNNRTKLYILCKNNHNFHTTFQDLNKGNWCAECSGNKKLTIEKIKNYIKSTHPNAKLLSTEYKNNKEKLSLECENKHEFKMCFANITQNQWCPKCKVGRGERTCAEYLEKFFGHKFIKVRPKNLINPKTNKKLEFDGYCKELNIAFEYQGRQHYVYPNHCHTNKEKYFTQLKIDEVKRQYCKKNNIILLEIKQFGDIRNLNIIRNIFKELIKYPEVLKLIEPSSSQQS